MKTIKGTWFEFKHHNVAEGKYWNPVCRRFTDGQWRAKIREMHHIGMEYVVLMCSSLVYENEAEAYFKTDIYPFPEDMVCKDPIGVLLDECDKCDMKVFVSCGFYGVWSHTYENMTSSEVTARAFKAMDELWDSDGIFPAYHMNKRHWITVLLDGTVPTETVKKLLDVSFDATNVKIKKKQV